MSSLVHHAQWGAIRQEFNMSMETIEGCSVAAYRPKKATTLVTLSVFTLICNETFANVKARFYENVHKKPLGFFSVKPLSTITQSMANLSPDGSKNTLATIAKFLHISGLTMAEYIKCVEKGAAIAQNYFEVNGNPIFAYGSKLQDYSDWQTRVVVATMNFAYAAVGMRVSSEEVQYTQEELEFFGMDPKKIKVQAKFMSCLSFALLKTKELRGKDLIFNKYPEDELKHLTKLLIEWNYRPVKDPDEGDLVLYLTSDKVVEHVGYITPEGKVQSKIGIANTFSQQHGIFEIPPGSAEVVFFRKSVALEE